MANDHELLGQLLSKIEGDTLDFKRNQYKLESDRQKAQLIKDFICMANTPRSDSAYIVIGVASESGVPTEVIDVDEHPDPAELSRIIAPKVSSMPQFDYRIVHYEGKRVGLIEILPDRRGVPFMLNRDFSILRKGVVYFRRNSENAEAGPIDIERIIQWRVENSTASHNTVDIRSLGSWDQVFRACDGFDPRRVFIAVLDALPALNESDWKAFATVGWNIVIDFDQDSDTSGGYLNCQEELSKRKSLRLAALDEISSLPLSMGSSVWAAANGLKSRPTTIRSQNWREWNHTTFRPLSHIISELARVTEPQPVTVVILGGDPVYVESVCDAIDQSFGERGDFVVLSPQLDIYENTIQKLNGTAISLDATEFCRGLRSVQAVQDAATDVELPRFEGGTALVPADRVRWLEEELEIVHSGLGTASSSPDSELRDFLRGLPISWYGLNVRIDIDRSLISRLEQHLHTELSSRQTRRANLWHWPGAGGSTVARRIAWNIHSEFPTMIAKRLNTATTLDRIQYLFSLTRLSSLIVIDSASITRDDVNRLYDQVRSANTPAVFLQIDRHMGGATSSKVSPYLDAMLTTPEAVALAHALSREVPEKRRMLEEIIEAQDRRRRTAFYFGLVAFGRDFAGLENYISTRLNSSLEAVKTVCRVSALAYHYGQKEVPLQLFSDVFKFAPNKLVRFSELLPDHLRELFVEVGNNIRPAHELIAEELLEQLLSEGRGERRNWRTALADVTVDFLELAAACSNLPKGEISQLARTIVIERSAEDTPAGPWEGRFSRLIIDIPSTEGKQRVFESLTRLFPDEPHFWAHLGRYYSRTARNHDKAHETHNIALELAEHDPTIHHMAGMAWRADLDDLLDRLSGGDLNADFEAQIKNLVEEAGREFAEARRLDPRSEYNYISHIQVIELVIGRVARLKGFGFDTAAFLSSQGQHWYRDLIDEAERLFSELSLVRSGDETTRYRQEARTRLDRLYGNYSKVIEGWTNLLSRTDVYRPPIRRAVINAYVSRRSHEWSSLTESELSRISDLAIKNLDEEPDVDQNLRLWFRAVRLTREVPIERAAERLAYKRLRNPTIDTVYYLYILKFLQSELGDLAMADEAREIIAECSRLVQNLPHRTQSFEWLGKEKGLRGLVHASALGEWDTDKEFWTNEPLLRRVTGRIARIQAPGSGEIELPTGLRAFFVPARGTKQGGYQRGSDEGHEVEFYLGFSYDGLRAWSVADLDKKGA